MWCGMYHNVSHMSTKSHSYNLHLWVFCFLKISVPWENINVLERILWKEAGSQQLIQDWREHRRSPSGKNQTVLSRKRKSAPVSHHTHMHTHTHILNKKRLPKHTCTHTHTHTNTHIHLHLQSDRSWADELGHFHHCVSVVEWSVIWGWTFITRERNWDGEKGRESHSERWRERELNRISNFLMLRIVASGCRFSPIDEQAASHF